MRLLDIVILVKYLMKFETMRYCDFGETYLQERLHLDHLSTAEGVLTVLQVYSNLCDQVNYLSSDILILKYDLI